jgi:hypothetical protein
MYSVFQGFSKAKSANGGSILSSSQFLILPQLPQKIKLTLKVVKVNSKIIISLPKILIPETHCRMILETQFETRCRKLAFFKDPDKLGPIL